MRGNVLEYLENSVHEFPMSLAVIEEDRKMTYAQLHNMCLRVGTALLSQGVGKNGVIVVMEKGSHALASQLGAVYAGAYYVPADPDIPKMRLLNIIGELGDCVVITEGEVSEHIKEMDLDIPVLLFDDLVSCEPDEDTLGEVRSKTLAIDPVYVLFTSGSTGTPKGVVINHAAIISFIDSFVETFGICHTDRIANQAPFDFDVSTKDIYSSLAVSATLVIIPRRFFMQPLELVSFLDNNRVTVLIWAVAALCILSAYHALSTEVLSSVEKVLFSGEVMPAKHLALWRKHLPHALFANLYGPTEVTCNCLYHILDPEDDYPDGVPLGVPFGHCDVILLDANGNEVVEAGKPGEIFVRSPSLALGYLGQSDLTARSFVQNPLNDLYPDRTYKTGDIASLDGDGRLFFRGRRDNQVKYHGHRIELEEIDVAFEQIAGVERCRCAFDDGKKSLYAFYEGDVHEGVLAAVARRELPIFMKPTKILKVDGMPLNKNGKVDRAKLLASAKRKPMR